LGKKDKRQKWGLAGQYFYLSRVEGSKGQRVKESSLILVFRAICSIWNPTFIFCLSRVGRSCRIEIHLTY